MMQGAPGRCCADRVCAQEAAGARLARARECVCAAPPVAVTCLLPRPIAGGKEPYEARRDAVVPVPGAHPAAGAWFCQPFRICLCSSSRKVCVCILCVCVCGGWQDYTQAVDVWSVGCIFAEMLSMMSAGAVRGSACAAPPSRHACVCMCGGGVHTRGPRARACSERRCSPARRASRCQPTTPRRISTRSTS